MPCFSHACNAGQRANRALWQRRKGSTSARFEEVTLPGCCRLPCELRQVGDQQRYWPEGQTAYLQLLPLRSSTSLIAPPTRNHPGSSTAQPWAVWGNPLHTHAQRGRQAGVPCGHHKHPCLHSSLLARFLHVLPLHAGCAG